MPEFVRRIPEGDNRERLVCPSCGHVAYENPKIVVGSVVVEGERVLLCRRAIAPGRGLWTLPAGFLELGETVEQGAAREALEEAEAAIAIEGLLAVFTISRIAQVQLIFRARFAAAARFAPGPESLEVGLFAWPEIPWERLAFPSVKWALHAWREHSGGPIGRPGGNAGDHPRGTAGLRSANAPVAAARVDVKTEEWPS